MTAVPRQFAIFLAVLAVLYALGYTVGRIIKADGSGDPGHGTPAADHGEVRPDARPAAAADASPLRLVVA